MSATDIPQGKLYVRPARQNETVSARLVIGKEWGVVIFADRAALDDYAATFGYRIIEGYQSGDDD